MVVQDLNSKENITTNIPVQRSSDGGFKNYTIAYFVFEHPTSCSKYPASGELEFFDIALEYNYELVKQPHWQTGNVNYACSFHSKVLNDSAVQITWKA
eukprot:TRINITY_DN66920_c2_g6_i2.p1 TRINITY_DN66920_c2_g6~~TRINITY_DN66920_c2_g6_i2.p1  ORF type:complete len:110 (-),score=16.95 TRINITY_DN66920_c2_g6_i2:203-496(-)